VSGVASGPPIWNLCGVPGGKSEPEPGSFKLAGSEEGTGQDEIDRGSLPASPGAGLIQPGGQRRYLSFAAFREPYRASWSISEPLASSGYGR